MIPTIVILVAVLVVSLTIFLFLRERQYKIFVERNSECLRELRKINSDFSFLPCRNCNQAYTYDSENNYESVSCEDFLIYQLQYQARQITEQINNARRNKTEYNKYKHKVKTLRLGVYSAPTQKLKPEKLLKIEKAICKKEKLPSPTTSFSVTVTLYRCGRNKTVYDSKRETFPEEKILILIKRLNNKSGGFYRDREIWDALCRVERGKVSNRMRFSIYERDGYRCRNCGISGNYANLEIDHIIPISKGGKSSYDNLQTLCHNCNVEKGSSLPNERRF